MKKLLFCVAALLLLAGCKTKTVTLDETFFINFAKAAKIKDTAITLSFFDVVDSRCPEDAPCPGPGEAQVTLHIVNEGELQPITFTYSNEPVTQTLDGFNYTLEQLLPIPNTQVPFIKKDYKAFLSVSRNYSLEDTQWQLSAYGLIGESLTPALTDVPASLLLDSRSELATIETSCLNYSANFDIDSPRLLLTGITGNPYVNCEPPRPEVEAQNDTFLETLSAATEYSIDSFGLTITTDDGRILKFEHPDAVLRKALTKNKTLWKNSGISSYRYTYNRSCFCIPFTRNIDVWVFDHKILDAVDPETEQTIPLEELAFVKTVNQLFAEIEYALEIGADRIDVTFSEEYGYPKEVSFDFELDIADDEISYRISDFQRLEP